MKPATVNRKAKMLMDMGKIRARLTELQSEAAEKSKLTLESHLEKLRELRDAAADFGQFSAAIRAEIARGKAAGLYREQIDLNSEPLRIIVDYGEGEELADLDRQI